VGSHFQINQTKWTENVAQVAELLLYNCKALCSIVLPEKKKKAETQKY
jgi:hypothetical protein